jgi:hypothetical protein
MGGWSISGGHRDAGCWTQLSQRGLTPAHRPGRAIRLVSGREAPALKGTQEIIQGVANRGDNVGWHGNITQAGSWIV